MRGYASYRLPYGKLILSLPLNSSVAVMKRLPLFVSVLLNVMFCALLLLFFIRNSFLRPYAGSPTREVLAGLLVLGSLYANYFLLYPKIYVPRAHMIYWMVLLVIAISAGSVEILIVYRHVTACNAYIIQAVGVFNFIATTLLLLVGRNLAINLFPFLLREKKFYQQALEKEVKTVRENFRMLDVADKKNNLYFISVDDIYYCQQSGNYTRIRTVQGKTYDRLCSMRILEHFLEGEEFIRVNSSVLLPLRYIKSCRGDRVTMKKMPWAEETYSFQLDRKRRENVSAQIKEGLKNLKTRSKDWKVSQNKTPYKPAVPPQTKIDDVLVCIQCHPDCNSRDIVTCTQYSLSTVERCLAELRKQGRIEYVGSKKNGGYEAVKTVNSVQS